jgi:L-fuconolactonase
MVIDSHQHFWHYTLTDYGWIGEDMAAIQRDFLPEHLLAEMDAVGVDGAISVQARQSVAETAWLLDLARHCERLRGVVGWVPLCDPAVEAELERLAASPALRGVRHVVQGEPDDEFILRPDFNRGIAALWRFELAYDILIFERHLPATLRFVDRHPRQRFIVDHIAKPRLREGLLEPWASRLRELARRPNVWCKLSGVVTEADPRAWTVAQLRPYLLTVLEAFGPERVLFGSDWPVCLVACPYGRWLEIVRSALGELSAAEQAAILGGNAERAYRLTPSS